jgi:hypothetical protein
VDENPYKSPSYGDTSVEASLELGEKILLQIAARSPSKRSWLFGLREEVIGKFIVTNRRVMFLSSGRSGNFGITESSMVRRIAESVDFAAMSKRSSWEFELSKVRSAEAWIYRIWTAGCHLRLTGTDESDRDNRCTSDRGNGWVVVESRGSPSTGASSLLFRLLQRRAVHGMSLPSARQRSNAAS